MEMEFLPEQVIERLCAHHKVKPARLLAAMLEALARYQLFGHRAFPDLQPADPAARPDVFSELEAHLIHLDPERHGRQIPAASLFEAVMLCVDFEQRKNEDHAETFTKNENPKWLQGEILGALAREQRVLLLTMKQCLNQIEAMRLEMAIEGESC